MDKATERFFALLKLMENCRSKLHGLYNLFNSNIISAKTYRASMGVKYNELLDEREKLLQIDKDISGMSKTAKSAYLKANKNNIKKISNEVKEIEDEYRELLRKYNSVLDDCIKYRSEYKHEVSLCCKTFNVMKNDDIDRAILKGYKQQVKLIRAILNKIDELIENYNVEKELVKADSNTFIEISNSIGQMILDFCE